MSIGPPLIMPYTAVPTIPQNSPTAMPPATNSSVVNSTRNTEATTSEVRPGTRRAFNAGEGEAISHILTLSAVGNTRNRELLLRAADVLRNRCSEEQQLSSRGRVLQGGGIRDFPCVTIRFSCPPHP